MSLELQDVSVGYGATRVVEGASTRLAGGGLAALVGPNGAGKSTLLKGLAGLLTASGRVSLDGAALAPAARRAAIAYMPQDLGASSSLTLVEVVLLGRLGSLGLRVPGELVEAALAALRDFGLEGLQGRTLDAVSGGQRQLVYLAQALFRQPRVLLLDEPTAALDLRHQLLVLEALRRHCAARGTVALAAMHDLTLAAQFADRMLCLAEGRIEAEGRPEAVLTEERLHRVYGVQAQVATGPGGRPQITLLRASE